jgi:hypothetical protein
LALLANLLLVVPAQADQGGRDQGVALTPASRSEEEAIQAKYAQLPLYFIENRGQMDGRVAFYLQNPRGLVCFTRTGATFLLSERGRQSGTPGDVLAQSADETPEDSEPAKRWVVKLDSFAPFVASDVSVFQNRGAGVWRTLAGPGRAAVVERQPLLEALWPVNGQPNLLLCGIPGHDYDILSTPALTAAGGSGWVWYGTMPSDKLWMRVAGLTNIIAPALFFRAEDRFG